MTKSQNKTISEPKEFVKNQVLNKKLKQNEYARQDGDINKKKQINNELEKTDKKRNERFLF